MSGNPSRLRFFPAGDGEAPFQEALKKALKPAISQAETKSELEVNVCRVNSVIELARLPAAVEQAADGIVITDITRAVTSWPVDRFPTSTGVNFPALP